MDSIFSACMPETKSISNIHLKCGSDGFIIDENNLFHCHCINTHYRIANGNCTTLTCDNFLSSHPSSSCLTGGFSPQHIFALLSQRPGK